MVINVWYDKIALVCNSDHVSAPMAGCTWLVLDTGMWTVALSYYNAFVLLDNTHTWEIGFHTIDKR
jgi:hypothetical protein